MRSILQRLRILRIVDVRDQMPGHPQYRGDARQGDIRGIAIHHSATADRYTGSPTGDSLTFFTYHVEHLGWRRGGYHYVIHGNGKIEYALDEAFPANHAGFSDPDDVHELEHGQYWNQHYLAICLVGWFEDNRTYTDVVGNVRQTPNRYTQPTAAQIESLVSLIRDIGSRHDVPVDHIQGHRELKGSSTLCPGPNLNLDELRHRLRRELQSQTPPPRRRLVAPRARFLIPRLKDRLILLFDTALRISYKAFIAVAVATVSWALFQPLSLTTLLIFWLCAMLLIPALPVLSLLWHTPQASRAMRHLQQVQPTSVIYHEFTPYKQSPAYFYASILAAEDGQFFRHAGFSWIEIYRALRARRLGSRQRGASTITQQLVKNLFLWPKPSYIRKWLEAILTIYMEALLPKWRILELYINFAQMGETIFGVGAASRILFRKLAAELSLEESVIISSALPNPHLIKPTDAPQHIIERRQRITSAVMKDYHWFNRWLRLYPIDPPLVAINPSPIRSQEALATLLDYHHITYDEFAPYSDRYFYTLTNLLTRHKVFRKGQMLNRFNFSEAVRRFQALRGLAEDGIPGQATLWALQYPLAVKRHLPLETVKADLWRYPKPGGYDASSDGIETFDLRADAAIRYNHLREEIHSLGAISASSGSTSSLNEFVDAEHSRISLDYLGLAFNLAPLSGMQDPSIDPFIITQEGPLWRVWACTSQGLPRDLQAVVWHDGRCSTLPITATVVDFTAAARNYGFFPAPYHEGSPEIYTCPEWWHFQCEDVLTPWISQFGVEILAIPGKSLPYPEHQTIIFKSRSEKIVWY